MYLTYQAITYLQPKFVRNCKMSSFYLIFVGLLISGTYGDSTSTNPAVLYCPYNEFKCVNGEKCIPKSFHCDDVLDCGDSSDEHACSWPHCHDSEHRCDNGTCVYARKVCDNIRNCEDGTDEENCGKVLTCKVNEFMCEDEKKCIPMRYHCDRAPHCADFSDEDEVFCGQECPDGSSVCDNGQCVRDLFFCDGRQHCRDGSDEKGCGFKDSDIIYFNEGNNIYLKKRTKAGHEFTQQIPISRQMKATGLHARKITGLSLDVKLQQLFVSKAGEAPAILLLKLTHTFMFSGHWIYFVRDGLVSPMDIAFDSAGNNLYFIDSGTGKAEVAYLKAAWRTTLVRDLPNPVALALSPNSGVMFIVTTTGLDTNVLMYGMDGSNRRILDSVQGSPASLAVHPTKSLLYWTDPAEGTISYVNFSSTSPSKIVRKNIDRVMSVTVTEQDLYFTSGEPEDFTTQRVNRIKIPGSEKAEGWNCITSGTKPSGKNECLKNNGGCKNFCLTTELGKKCACSSGWILAEDGTSCRRKK